MQMLSRHQRDPGSPVLIEIRSPERRTQLHSMNASSVVTMPSSRVTRVGVNDETWQAFRQLALLRGISVSDYLAKLVARELARRPETNARLVALDAPPEEQALAALTDARDALLELDDIAGRLARSAYELGGNWKDIGSSLGIGADAARRFYEQPRK